MAEWIIIHVYAAPQIDEIDEDGNPAPNVPLSGAKVCLVPRADVNDARWPFADLTATHTEGEPGVYQAAAAPADPTGEFLLVVSGPEKSPTSQRLRVVEGNKVRRSDENGLRRLVPGWESIPIIKDREKPGYSDGPEPAKGKGAIAATISMPRFRHFKGEDIIADRIPIKVVLHPVSDLVFMATADYKNVKEPQATNDPLDYRNFADGRRNRMYARRNRRESIYRVPKETEPNFNAELYDEQVNGVNPGTVYTLYWCHDRTKVTMLKSREARNSSWVLIDSEEMPLPAEASATESYFKNDKRPRNVPTRAAVGSETPADIPHEAYEWSIADFYQELEDRGRETPGSVVEAGLFGHGWYAGPLVWSTSDFEPSFVDRWAGGNQPDNTGNDAPAIADLDGRQKDWFRPERDKFPNIIQAFQPGRGTLGVWGCNHLTAVLSEGRRALARRRRGVDAQQMVQFPLLIADDKGNQADLGTESGSEQHIAKNIEQFFSSVRNERAIERGDARGVAAYCGVTAAFLGIPTFGAPPGSGASYISSRQMEVERFKGEPCIQFMKEVFGGAYQESAEGYVDYRAMFDIADLPDPGW